MEQYSPTTEVIFFFIGIVLVGISSLGRLWCTLYIAGNKTGTLVTEGPFSLCRNPLYFFSFHNLVDALERNNISTGAGYIENRGEYYVVRADSRLAGIKEIESVVIGERGNFGI